MAPLLTNAGRAIISNLVSGIGGTVPKFVAMGTGNTAEAVTQTALVGEVENRATGVITRITVTVTNDTIQVVGTVTATTARSIVESGLFDVITSSSGNMLVRGVFGTITLANTDSITFTWTLQWT